MIVCLRIIKISEHIERLVNLLKSDEPEVDPSDGDLPDEADTHEPAVGSSIADDTSDDEDSRIDEV